MTISLQHPNLFPIRPGEIINGPETRIQISSISNANVDGFTESCIHATIKKLPECGNLGLAISSSPFKVESEIVLRGHPSSSVFESDSFAGLTLSIRRDRNSVTICPLLELSWINWRSQAPRGN